MEYADVTKKYCPIGQTRCKGKDCRFWDESRDDCLKIIETAMKIEESKLMIKSLTPATYIPPEGGE